MANTNPQAVAFANNYARVVANDIVSCYLSMKRLKQVWDGQNMVSVIPNDATVIADGSAVDGRTQITNGQVNIMIANSVTLIQQFEANANLILNQMLQIQVNAQSVVS
jgi:bifunctional ADP-heptose synthase (sugar kinase/adenylyltransferase)